MSFPCSKDDGWVMGSRSQSSDATRRAGSPEVRNDALSTRGIRAVGLTQRLGQGLLLDVDTVCETGERREHQRRKTEPVAVCDAEPGKDQQQSGVAGMA